MLTYVVRMFTSAREDEVAPTIWATTYGFFIMFSYYILRAVRDEISTVNRGNLQYLWTATFLTMLVIVPLYSWLGSRLSRAVFVPFARLESEIGVATGVSLPNEPLFNVKR